MHQLAGLVRRCIDDYNMINRGETIAIGMSGGKDSLALLYAMADLRRYHPSNFNLHAVTLKMGFDGMDFTPIKNICDKLDVPYIIKQTNIARVVFDEREEKNPCSLCSSMRRAAMCDTITQLGIKKVALAHQNDDAVETFLMSLLYEGRLHCFRPVTYLSRTDTTQIRPMLYVKEDLIIKLIEKHNLPVVKNTCPISGVSKREEIKILLSTLKANHPDIKAKLFGAMQRLPLAGWEK